MARHVAKALLCLVILPCCLLLPAGAAVGERSTGAGVAADRGFAFRFVYGQADSGVADDVKKTLEAYCPIVRADLQFMQFTDYTVVIYADQRSYDDSLEDRSVAGSPACSGAGKISLVSALRPIRVSGISYEQRLLMAVHEYAHLLVNEINVGAPMWLQEGIACYEGSGGNYIEKGSGLMKRVPPGRFAAIENEYYETPLADVYSFLAVKFIVERYGMGSLNRLLRNPEDFEAILSAERDEFDRAWNEYIELYKAK